MDILGAIFLLGVGGQYLGAKNRNTQSNQINAKTAEQLGETILNSERPLGQNIYATDDLLRANLDLERRATEVYPVAVAKQQSEKRWAKSTLDAVDDGSKDGAWTMYAAPTGEAAQATIPGSIEESGTTSFDQIPFDEKPYLKGSNDKSVSMSNRRFEQMTNLGVGGYRPKQEQLATVNGAQNPVALGMIDNVQRYDPTQRLASTYDGSNIPSNNTVNDVSNPEKTYFADAVPRVKAQANLNPTTELRYDGLSGGNPDAQFSAPALTPQNYEVNHRRNVEGTMINQIRRGNQVDFNQPQGYNSYENQGSIPQSKLKKGLADIKSRWGPVVIDRGQSGITAGNIAELQSRYSTGQNNMPQTSIESSTRSNNVGWNSERFSQIANYNNGSTTGVRDNIFVPPTLKEETLFSHQGHISNSEMANAGYLSRTDPMRTTMKDTLLRPNEQGVAVQHTTPYQGSYLDTEKNLDVQMTNSASITPVMTRTPGVYISGDTTRSLPSAPNTTNKEVNTSIGGQRIMGGAGSHVPAAAIRGWGASDRKTGLEVMDGRAFVPWTNDDGLGQLDYQEQQTGASLRPTKYQNVSDPSNFGVNVQRNIPSTQTFQQIWHDTAKQPKR